MKTIGLALVCFLLGAGSYLLIFGSSPDAGKKNADMLSDTTGGIAVISESDVAYFDGAKGFFARPAAQGDYPGVVLIHENRGLRPEIRQMALQLAKSGYQVLAVDLLGNVVETQTEARALTAAFNQKNGIENMRAAIAYLRSKGTEKIASLGWCFGGAQSLQLALSGEPLDATVIYYGRLATSTAVLSPIKWPVLGIFGGADTSISVESVNQFQSALDRLSVQNEIHIYPGVGHAFANPSGMNYAPVETADAWEKTIAFLAESLKQ
jgi:carboxymethylenebutenolidase